MNLIHEYILKGSLPEDKVETDVSGIRGNVSGI